MMYLCNIDVVEEISMIETVSLESDEEMEEDEGLFQNRQNGINYMESEIDPINDEGNVFATLVKSIN